MFIVGTLAASNPSVLAAALDQNRFGKTDRINGKRPKQPLDHLGRSLASLVQVISRLGRLLLERLEGHTNKFC